MHHSGIIKPGSLFKIKNKGINNSGHLYIHFQVDFPNTLSEIAIERLLKILPSISQNLPEQYITSTMEEANDPIFAENEPPWVLNNKKNYYYGKMESINSL